MDDLYNFMRQLQDELAAEYKRIQARVKEDPGIAGTQGEENWAALLRAWLPSTYHVVTRGRIINHTGRTSPEVDLLVLHPAYPRHLLNKKHYLTGGVIAAFECKLTLTPQHLAKAFDTCLKIKTLMEPRTGTPYKELNQPPIYGILAHAHAWKSKLADGAFAILESIHRKQFRGPQLPREMLDLVCVANVATFSLSKDLYVGKYARDGDARDFLRDFKAPEGVSTGYVCTWQEPNRPYMGTALGNLVCALIQRFAFEDSSLRGLAHYYVLSSLATGGIARPNLWHSDILSQSVRRQLAEGPLDESRWSEWTQRM